MSDERIRDRAPLVAVGQPVADTVDLADMARTVRRQWRALATLTLLGVVVAGLVIMLAPRRFQAASTVVVRAGSDPAGSLLSRLGGADGGGLGGLITAGMKSPIETEIQVLQSRSVVGMVVDSLQLQARVREPDGLPPTALVRRVDAPGTFKPVKLSFERDAAGGAYRVDGPSGQETWTPGTPVRLPVGRLELRDSLPASFVIQVYDREDAITRAVRSLSVSKAGGEVVRVSYRAPDSLTAAAVTNGVIDTYLTRRKTTDRGTTEYRTEFLAAQVDTIGQQLSAAEHALRRHQEQSGVIDAPIVAELQLEEAGKLRQELGVIEVEERALSILMERVRSGDVTARQIASYPTFLKTPGVNDLLSRLSSLETERTRLLERRLETDPEVMAVSRGIADLEAQLIPIATTYTASLRQQRADMRRQLGAMEATLAAFPAAAQSTVRLQRDVMRLGQIHAALQAQLVEARLAAITEGGDVRQLDAATAPKQVVFPNPVLTMGLGLGGGLMLGLIAALMIGTMGRYVDDPRLIERTTGVPALPLHAAVPLLVAGGAMRNTVLLVPLNDGISTEQVADRMAQTALARALPATVLDLTASANLPSDGVHSAIARLEAAEGMVIVRLPELASDATVAALSDTRPVYLVAEQGRVDRAQLREAVETLRRLDVPCAGVVMNGDRVNHRARARLSV